MKLLMSVSALCCKKKKKCVATFFLYIFELSCYLHSLYIFFKKFFHNHRNHEKTFSFQMYRQYIHTFMGSFMTPSQKCSFCLYGRNARHTITHFLHTVSHSGAVYWKLKRVDNYCRCQQIKQT